MFIDKANIIIKAGNGGAGSAAFRREKFVPRGGPNGGDGGKGGDVYLVATERLRTLLDFARKPRYDAPSGEGGLGYHKFGKSGHDLVLEVPCGTTVIKAGEILADMVRPGDRLLVARGGQGGRGNVHFKSSVRQAPRIAEKGEPGESANLTLELKLIADVGLIGFPNAGKSTLLSRLTRAHPKIADYPFTTLFPNLGVAVIHDREIIFADIPGLIEGSHQGKGLGHEFLRHIERTRILLHVVDPLGFDSHAPKAGVQVIQAELKSHSQELFKKPRLLIINKQDVTGAEQILKEFKKSQKTVKTLGVSGVSGQGISELLNEVAKMLDKIPLTASAFAKASADKPADIRIRLEPDFWVEKANAGFVVKGKKVERLVAMTHFGLPEAVERTQNILKKMGVERQLAASGAAPGDPVKIGAMEFTFEPVGEIS